MADETVSPDSMIAEFQAITGCEVERAKFYIESANGQLDLAISSFYESAGDDFGDMDSADVPPPAAAAVPPPAAAPVPTAGSGAGRIGTINFPDEDSDSDEDEDRQHYAGGSTHSGTAIIGPGGAKKKDIVGQLFKRARDAGAEEVQGGEPGPSASRAKSFAGGGFKLGSDEAPSQFVGKPEDGSKSAPPRTFVLKMWQEGFSLDDGDLRRYDDAANGAFLQNIMRGTIPNELIREAQGGEVHVDMEDHRNEEFVKPKRKVKPFEGSGNVLGSIAPQVVAPSSASATDPAAAEAKAKSDAKLDESQPTTNIQVRLADGSRLIVKLNHEQTVGVLRQYICTARPQYSSTPFVLATTFPNKELSDDSQTLKAAGLLGAAVLQRLK